MTENETPKETENKDELANETEEDTTQLEKDLIRQVEYYFGDANLPRDKFLREQVKLDDGWVPFDIMIKFNRLAKISTDLEFIANALNKSNSGLLEISDDLKKVRRNPELPLPEMNEENRKEICGRTVYAKGFPKDAVLDDIFGFFKDHGEIVNITMRRYVDKETKTKKFKGSVFATFKLKEDAEKFYNTKGLKYGDTELIVRWQDDYIKEKQEEYLARKEKKEKKTKEPVKERNSFQLPTGTVLKFSNVYEKMTREDVKEALEPLGGQIAFIAFHVGASEGWVRYAKEDAAKEVAAKIIDNKVKVGPEECEVVFKLLEGEEEKLYLDKTIEDMSSRKKNTRNKRQWTTGKGKKRKLYEHSDAPRSKIKADA